jgi:PAS domain S-box-containing protein
MAESSGSSGSESSAIAQSEARFRAMVDSAPVLVWIANASNACVWFNKPWLQFVGRTMEHECAGSRADSIHPADLDRCLEAFSTHSQARQPFMMEYRLRRHDGAYRWVLDNAVPLYDPAGEFDGYIGSCVDITDRKQAEAATKLLADAGAAFASSINYEKTLEELARLVVPGFADWCSIDLKDVASGDIRRAIVVHSDPDKVELAHELRRRYPPKKDDPAGVPHVIRSGETIWAAAFPEDVIRNGAQDADHARILLGLQLRSYICVPLIARGRPIGALTLVTAESSRTYTPADVAVAEELGRRAGVAADTAALFETARRNEAALAESEAKFRQLVNTIPQLAWMAKPDGWIFWYNDRWYDYTDTTPQQMEGWGWEKVHDPAELPRIKERWGAAIAEGVAWEDTFPLRRHDGQMRWHLSRAMPLRDADGRVLLWFGTNTDITEAREARGKIEQLNRELSQRLGDFETLLNVAPIGIAIARDAECRQITVNKMFAEWVGVDPGSNVSGSAPEDERTRPYSVLRDGREVPASELPIQKAAAIAQDVRNIELELVRADGHKTAIFGYARPLFDEHGKVRGSLGAFIDVTERKRVEEERARLLEAERAARLDAEHVSRMKDEFLATLSHELRTPLNAILGWSQILKRTGADDEDFEHGLEAIERNARSQTQLIEDLLDMSRIISGKVRMDVKRVGLAEIVDAAVESIAPAAEAKKVKLEKTFDPLAAFVSADPGRLQQVVWNLLSNAVKFTPSGGTISIAVERVNSHMQMRVSDTGKGIRPEFLPFVFERFRQEDASTTRRYGGLGLGLSIVKHLVELHGGSIEVSSPGEGQGSTFTIALPVSAVTHDHQHHHESAANSSPANDDFRPPDFNGVKILIVDDDQDAREIMSRMLVERGAVALTASSAADGLMLLQRDRPKVLISDIGMPITDGYEFIRQVRSMSPEAGGTTPAIALTAFARPDDRRRALLAGFQMHLVKPVDPAELLTVCASLAGLMHHSITPPRPPH